MTLSIECLRPVRAQMLVDVFSSLGLNTLLDVSVCRDSNSTTRTLRYGFDTNRSNLSARRICGCHVFRMPKDSSGSTHLVCRRICRSHILEKAWNFYCPALSGIDVQNGESESSALVSRPRSPRPAVHWCRGRWADSAASRLSSGLGRW